MWATAWGDRTVVELDPGSLRVLRRLDVGPYPAGLAQRAGSIWVGFGRSATSVVRIDPSDGSLTRVSVGVKTPAWFSGGTRDLWITADDNALVHLDPRTEKVVGTTRFGRTLGHPTAGGDGTVWVPDKEIDRVFRVDPASGRPAGFVRRRGRRVRGAPCVRLGLGHELRRVGRLALPAALAAPAQLSHIRHSRVSHACVFRR